MVFSFFVSIWKLPWNRLSLTEMTLQCYSLHVAFENVKVYSKVKDERKVNEGYIEAEDVNT